MSVLVTERIAVIRALHGLGDLLCLVPALRSLRAGAPNASIACIGVPNGRWMLDRFPRYLDAWIDLPSWPSIPEADGDPGATVRMLASWSGHFDLVVQLQGSGGPINRLADVLTSDRVAVHVESDEAPESWQAPRVLARQWPDSGHEAARLAGLVHAAGFPDTGSTLEFPVRLEDRLELPKALSRVSDRPLAVVHPGASRPDRRWSTSGFAAVASRLDELGYRVVITGTSRELSVVGAVVDGCRSVPWVLVDAPLGALGALFRTAEVLVANDTGVAHLGVAVGLPTLVLGTTSDLDRWGPTDRTFHAVVRCTGDTSTDTTQVISTLQDLLRRHAQRSLRRVVS